MATQRHRKASKNWKFHEEAALSSAGAERNQTLLPAAQTEKEVAVFVKLRVLRGFAVTRTGWRTEAAARGFSPSA
jgi:hypothetical protein